ncbi:hypothetical protein UPYG_G00289370 [Umbra pygmaea]|uniref:Uncharacterized protein n=1 Tax=Umbra pygmaea TaxID=75934 RepID=A0ABD0W4H9_UMBPY
MVLQQNSESPLMPKSARGLKTTLQHYRPLRKRQSQPAAQPPQERTRSAPKLPRATGASPRPHERHTQAPPSQPSQVDPERSGDRPAGGPHRPPINQGGVQAAKILTPPQSPRSNPPPTATQLQSSPVKTQ